MLRSTFPSAASASPDCWAKASIALKMFDDEDDFGISVCVLGRDSKLRQLSLHRVFGSLDVGAGIVRVLKKDSFATKALLFSHANVDFNSNAGYRDFFELRIWLERKRVWLEL